MSKNFTPIYKNIILFFGEIQHCLMRWFSAYGDTELKGDFDGLFIAGL